MSKVKKELKRFGRRFEKNITRPIKRNIKPFFRDVEKGLRAGAAIALPVLGGFVGGPLGAAAGLQLSAQTPYIKKGWKDVTRELGNVTGIDWIKENPYKVAGIGSIGLGAYGLTNLAATGSTGWGWGGANAPGLNVLKLPGSNAPAAGGAGTGIGGTGSGSVAGGLTTTPTAKGIAAAKAAGIYNPAAAGSTISAGSTLAPAASTVGATTGAGVAGGASTLFPSSAFTPVSSLPSAASSGGFWGTAKGLVSGAGSALKGAGGALKSLSGIAPLGMLAYNMMNQPEAPAYEEFIPDYSGLVVSSGGVSDYDMMGGEYGQQWQNYIDQLSQYADDQRALYEQYANPVQKKYLEMVEQGIDPDIAASMAGTGVMQEYDAARNMLARQQAAMGINPSSPLYQSQQADLAASQALGQAQAMTQARQGAAGLNMQLLQQGAQYASGLGANVANLMGNVAGQYANRAGMYAQGQLNNAEIAQANAAMMTQANIGYASQYSQALITSANQNYTARLQNSYGLSQLAGNIFANWLFGGSTMGGSGSGLFS